MATTKRARKFNKGHKRPNKTFESATVELTIEEIEDRVMNLSEATPVIEETQIKQIETIEEINMSNSNNNNNAIFSKEQLAANFSHLSTGEVNALFEKVLNGDVEAVLEQIQDSGKSMADFDEKPSIWKAAGVGAVIGAITNFGDTKRMAVGAGLSGTAAAVTNKFTDGKWLKVAGAATATGVATRFGFGAVASKAEQYLNGSDDTVMNIEAPSSEYEEKEGGLL